MSFVARFILILAALAPACLAWAAAPVVSVTGSYPGLSGQLGRDAALYVRFSYRSDTPIRVQAQGYFRGEEVRKDVRWNPSPAYPAGEGEAMVWIAYSGATRLDELRIEVSDGDWHPLTIAKLPVSVAWSSAPGGERREPEWVDRLNAPQQDLRSNAGEDGFGFGMFDVLIGPLLAIGFPGYFVLQGLFAWRYSSGWRIAALAPLLIMVPALAHAVFALSMGSNLWPLLVIFTAPVMFLYLCGLGATRFVVRGGFA